jgi:hypothetical protein
MAPGREVGTYQGGVSLVSIDGVANPKGRIAEIEIDVSELNDSEARTEVDVDPTIRGNVNVETYCDGENPQRVVGSELAFDARKPDRGVDAEARMESPQVEPETAAQAILDGCQNPTAVAGLHVELGFRDARSQAKVVRRLEQRAVEASGDIPSQQWRAEAS